MLTRASSGSSGGGGGADMSPLFGVDVAYVTTETTEYPVCPLIGVNHINIKSRYGTSTCIFNVTDKNGNKTQLGQYSGTTNNVDVSNYILLSDYRTGGGSHYWTIEYVD